MTDEEITAVEDIVNRKIRENIALGEYRDLPIEKAKEMGAMALFGEKYGDFVRVITFDPNYSIELCGGTHVHSTGQIGLFKLVSESAIAAGVRRIEAITADTALAFYNKQLELIDQIKLLVKNPVDVIRGVNNLIEENAKLSKEVEELRRLRVLAMKDELKSKIIAGNGTNVLVVRIDGDASAAKELAFALKAETSNFIGLFGYVADGKPGLTLIIDEEVAKAKQLNAGQMVKDLAKEIRGGGGGQPFFATAGGSLPDGLSSALDKGQQLLSAL